MSDQKNLINNAATPSPLAEKTAGQVSAVADGIVSSIQKSDKPLIISVPHAGERLPAEAPWLGGLSEKLLMFDVDRYVDRLYQPILQALSIPTIRTEWHRYAIDLNRLAEDFDASSVLGSLHPFGAFPRGLHWSITTTGEKLMATPMPMETHVALMENYFTPFHKELRRMIDVLREKGASVVYHLDAHSMPSIGTSEHRDPGEKRADVVISDCDGKSCLPWFRDLVISSYELTGLRVAYNWPYKGGRLTETYGQPALKQESIQVELNRALYMDETSKQLDSKTFSDVQQKLAQAIRTIYAAIPASRFPSS